VASRDRFQELRTRAKGVAGDALSQLSNVGDKVQSKWRANVQSDPSLLVEHDSDSVDDPGSSFVVPWVDLAEAGVRVAVLAASNALGGGALLDPAIALIRATIGIQDSQERLLASIESDVHLLRDGPFNTGRLFVQEASRVADDATRATAFIERAQAKFYEAHDLTASPLDRAIVQMHIGLTGLLLGQLDDAEHWLHEAYLSTTRVAQAMAEKTGNTKVLKSKWSVAAAAYMYPVGLVMAARKRQKVRQDELAMRGLRQVLPLVDSIASLHNGIPGPAEHLPVMRLIEVGEDRFALQQDE
jgi:hypothetical protein